MLRMHGLRAMTVMNRWPYVAAYQYRGGCYVEWVWWWFVKTLLSNCREGKPYNGSFDRLIGS